MKIEKKELADEKAESESFSRPLIQIELTRENRNFKFKRHLPARASLTRIHS